MHSLSLVTAIFAISAKFVIGLDESSLTKFTDSLSLDFAFKPVKAAYWTGFPHHRRTPFALSPDGTSAYIAYLDSSETDVHVQKVNPSTFAANGAVVTITGAKEAGGLVAHNDGFALLTNEALPSGTANAPASNTPVPVLYRYTNGEQSWKTFLGGPGVHEADGLSASPDLNGDLAYSESAKLYGAYFVVTDYTGPAAGHFGDSIQYIADDGTLQTIAGASSSWGCSHNTGIAFEAADEAPFASICAEDQGAIWLNTETQGMAGVKISNENTTNGGSGEPMGGMSGSYSSLARFQNSNSYIFSWVSRGAINLHQNEWLGGDYTQAYPRTTNRNVAIATFSDKNTLNGPQAISVVGAASGDDQVNWITRGSADCSNAHVSTFDASNALVTWEEIAEPTCDFVAMGCSGTFTGSFFQQVDGTGAKVGEPLQSMDTYVAGDMVRFPDGKICWPYVNMAWSLDANADEDLTKTSMSFACMSLTGSGSGTNSSLPSSTTTTSSSTTTWSTTPARSTTNARSTTPTGSATPAWSTTNARSTTPAGSTTPAESTTPARSTTPAKSTTNAGSTTTISSATTASSTATAWSTTTALSSLSTMVSQSSSSTTWAANQTTFITSTRAPQPTSTPASSTTSSVFVPWDQWTQPAPSQFTCFEVDDF